MSPQPQGASLSVLMDDARLSATEPIGNDDRRKHELPLEMAQFLDRTPLAGS
ncbi:MAG: hypothetical protein SWY16_12085 [Cyanobacteriota bacterium]|nr:hypothetical protein [Cyanobacteriota bacterium]